MNVDQHMPELSAYLGHARVSDTYWYLSAVPELMQLAAMRLEQTQKRKVAMKTNNDFPALIEAFFTDRLMRQRQMSPNTIASYRDSFCLLFNFAKQRLKKEPSILSIEDLDAAFIGSFLNHIEKDRRRRSLSNSGESGE